MGQGSMFSPAACHVAANQIEKETIKKTNIE